ncbi:hypothetical protein B9Z55_007050 [Caenorhabditis nigoni]|uniref:Uncharacterized protein n=1 Tax=Caenorhabditis nigoni TaxID=1611254 RepID=A0A2G5V7Y6_9PELO|nr:hypothetical protein B9Z55_007050 [Caenorhabditis nigoni]
MVSYSIPTDHQSLRTILSHTDPNMRFKIAQRIPKIRLTEKAVPLRIESLSLEEFSTTVNSQSYQLGIYRNYRTDEIPIKIKYSNNRGGVACDLDQYGFEIPNTSTSILNGDVSFRAGNVAIFQREKTEQDYQNSLRLYEDALAKINQLKSEGKTIWEFLDGPMTEDEQRISRIVRLHRGNIERTIEEYRTKLLPFHCRRNNLSPPFTCYIQLTITQGNVKTIQRYEYNHKLYEAAKKLNETLFSNRPVVIVDKFEGTSFNGVWRIPVGLKISANSISSVFGEYSQIVSFSSILNSSRTLQNVGVTVSVLNDQHSFVKNAQQLSISTRTESIHQLIRAFETMDNQQINIDLWGILWGSPSPYEYFQLLEGWLSKERSVGSVITFGLRTEYIGEKILELVINKNERALSRDRNRKIIETMMTYSVPMGYESLKTVLLHTDPNLRFKIAQRVPKICLTEKTVPLKIRSLSLREFMTTVNNTSYKLGVYRHFHANKMPMSIKRENDWGGINEYRNDPLPFRCRQKNISPQYTCYIQLTITKGTAATIQRYVNNHKLYETAKKLNEILFANRPVIIVNKLQGGRYNDVWRVPVGFKISASSISARSGYGDYKQIVPIHPLLDSSRTLRKVSFSVRSDVASNYQHSFVKHAQQLSIRIHKERINLLAAAFKTMENQQLNIGFLFCIPSPNEYFRLIQGWLSTERCVGSVITFELMTEYIGEKILELVRTRNERTESTDRFKIAQRIPKVRLTEKAVPLRINSLSLQEFKTTVNRTSYKLGVYRQYHTEDIPMNIKKKNCEGGVSYDLDQFGFKISNSSTPILNGDVSFRTENADNHQTDTEERARRLQISLRSYEDALVKINRLEWEGKTVGDFLAGPMTFADQLISRIVVLDKGYIERKIDEYRTNLIPFRCRQKNISPPFTCFIQLTITQRSVTTIQRYFCSYQLYEAAKKLNEFLFANRPVIIVNQFQSGRENDVWRIPVGLKISANSISTNSGCGNIMEIIPISSILDSSKKLRNVSFNFTPDEDSNYQHSFVKNAQQLTIHTDERRINQLARAFETMENQQIHIGFLFESPSPNEYYRLIQGWLSTERCVGSVITFELRTEYIGEKILELVITQNERAVSRDRWVKVVLGNGTNLKVSCWGLNVGNWPRFVLTAIIM